MTLSEHARAVNEYYDTYTEPFYIGPQGWDPEHLHFGIFIDHPEEEYRQNPALVYPERRAATKRMTEAILRPARLKPSDVVADAGCGVGGTVMHIAREHGSKVIGLNINEMQLKLASARAREAGLESRVSFQYCDCTVRLPFEDGSIDAIVNIESACHYDDRKTFISECARALKPGGRRVAGDWMVADGISENDRNDFIGPLSESWVLHDIESLSSYADLLTGAGFEVVEAEYLREGILPNGFLMRMGYEVRRQKAAVSGLNRSEASNLVRIKTFADALLGGHLQLGRYAAVRK
jgi:tocopherol O-methyltransferase